MHMHLLLERWNRILKVFANSLDQDQTPKNVASDFDQNCLLFLVVFEKCEENDD